MKSNKLKIRYILRQNRKHIVTKLFRTHAVGGWICSLKEFLDTMHALAWRKWRGQVAVR